MKERILTVVLVVALLTGAIVVFLAAREFSDQGKFVEVKGLSERIVKADRAIWSLNFEAKSNSIDDLFNQIQEDTDAIQSFLKDAGFSDEEISTAPPSMYQDTYQNSKYRYNARVPISVYTEQVDLVRRGSQNTLALIERGVVLSDNLISYEILNINDYKPAMLAEAIANARASAEQFADNSGAQIGDIARANQGVFAISDKDPASPEFKKVRLVSSLRYLIH